ncbi:Stk1 family PASTA domain-containing Ser/Thr kinase [Plantactinospora sp. KBS50]|uniref:Stk1 family PASTA domain-containing Ser/Thr kinase n=1 Tax=Plantactinospora sp. KBS50 TaxID=2024580 RepID=UPI000BAB238D|nr:Stk1 family PASTA domain-containing Ser/Thr kinase [Plantactinospora sp. KBS50]ASW52986.1 serine/threonine protein kinase [Plantactinospora sp. KBS50]
MTAQARLLGGRYQVGELLGYGGMAEVHRGRDLRLGRDVAIKMLRNDLARDATFQMRFRREAQNAASLNHPAIVAVYDTGEEIAPTGETIPFIVMEFVNGRTLKEVLAAEGRLMPRRAMEITADMCAALEFSHRHGIIHRDIKPGNVMLTLNGQVKVMDFGIARALASGATTMTQTSAVIGTAQYLSPEQARGEAVDARSDVYAAGCVLFELLCGHPPFVGDSPVSVAYQHVREDPPSPSSINPDVTPPIDAIVLKALSKNPLNRYQSAGEMRADLLRAAAGRPVMATPVMPAEETMTMAAAPAAGRQGQGGRPPASTRVGDAQRRRASAWMMAVLSALGVLAVVALVAALLVQKMDRNRVDVPNVAGMTQAQAETELSKVGLRLQPGDPQFTDDCTKDKVVDQDPTAGARANRQDTVTVSICGGKPSVTVPNNLVSGPYDYVKDQLEALGLKVKKESESSDKPEDTVLALDPKPGSKVEKGTEITVTVSSGDLKSVPNVVGMSQEAAIAILKGAGFNNVSVREGDVVPDNAGNVSDQNPTANEKKKTSTKITITVDQAPVEPTEPPSSPSSPPPSEPGTGGGTGGPTLPIPR